MIPEISPMSAPLNNTPLPLAVSMGDPAGVGLDIAIAAWMARKERAIPPFALYADPGAVLERAERLGAKAAIETVDAMENALAFFPRALPVVPIPLAAPAVAGRPDSANAPAVIAAIEAATAAALSGRAGALVTGPISKATLYARGFAYPGHTEFLAALAERRTPGRQIRPVMMLASDDLRVVPATVHIPLAEVPGAITRDLILETARVTHEALRRDFGVARPRIAVAGLNPHAGEGGALGREELDIIAPAIAALREEGLNVAGPHSADTLFHEAARKTYDAVIAMYHDQALIPLKTLAFDKGVNVTLGLPLVRASPDHGTAFDIAGTGRASPESFIAALGMAAAIARRRAEAGP